MKKYHREFGQKLHYVLLAKNVSPGDLSRESGISNAMISKYLSGKAAPTFDNLIKICGTLDILPQTLMPSDLLGDTKTGTIPGEAYSTLSSTYQVMFHNPEVGILMYIHYIHDDVEMNASYFYGDLHDRGSEIMGRILDGEVSVHSGGQLVDTLKTGDCFRYTYNDFPKDATLKYKAGFVALRIIFGNTATFMNSIISLSKRTGLSFSGIAI